MGSVCRNKGPDNEPGSENAKQNRTGGNAFVAEPGFYLLCFLLVFQDFLRGWDCASPAWLGCRRAGGLQPLFFSV